MFAAVTSKFPISGKVFLFYLTIEDTVGWFFHIFKTSVKPSKWGSCVYFLLFAIVCYYAEVYLGLVTVTHHVCDVWVCVCYAPTSWSDIFLSIFTSLSGFTWLFTLQNTDNKHMLISFFDHISCYILSSQLISHKTADLNDEKVPNLFE